MYVGPYPATSAVDPMVRFAYYPALNIAVR